MTRMEYSDMLMTYVYGLIEKEGNAERTLAQTAAAMRQLYTQAQLDAFVREFHPQTCPSCRRRKCRHILALAIDACFAWIEKAQLHRVAGNDHVH